MNHTKESMATLLNGREYGEEITREECADAKASGLLVIFGYSDDNIELRGVVDDEAGCYNGGKFLIDTKGFLPDWDEVDGEAEAQEYFARKASTHPLTVHWGKGDYAWTIETPLPHATFEIVEGDEKFCRGIVIDTKDMKGNAP